MITGKFLKTEPLELNIFVYKLSALKIIIIKITWIFNKSVCKNSKKLSFIIKNISIGLFLTEIQHFFVNIFCFKLGMVYICVDNTIHK